MAWCTNWEEHGEFPAAAGVRAVPQCESDADEVAGAVVAGRVEDWRHCSVGSVYPLLPVSVGSASLTEP